MDLKEWLYLLLFFSIILKFSAGIFGKSHALIADAVHSISDLFTDAVVLFGLRISQKPPDDTHHFGHARVETIASAIVGLALIATAFYLGIQSALDIYRRTEYHPTHQQLHRTQQLEWGWLLRRPDRRCPVMEPGPHARSDLGGHAPGAARG